MTIPAFEEIIEPNDQTEARAEHLEKLRGLTGNVYPNKFVRSRLTGGEDTISAIKLFGRVVAVEREMAEVKADLPEGQRPPAEVKDAINERLKAPRQCSDRGQADHSAAGEFCSPDRWDGEAADLCEEGAVRVGEERRKGHAG